MLNKPVLYNEQELSRINDLNKTINPNNWLEYVNPNESFKKNELIQTARLRHSFSVKDDLTLRDLPTIYKDDSKPPS